MTDILNCIQRGKKPMVVIRLARSGAKKAPFYHVVVADKRAARDGRYIEQIGYFNPVARGQAVRLEMKKDRVDYWLGEGAQASERVAALIKQFDKGMTAAIEPKPKAKKAVKVEAKAETEEAQTTEATSEDNAEAKDKA
jgi:small subunit ribosomal protein S16